MTPVPSPHYLARVSDALVSEIKAEMGRRDLSARGLALLIGENPQYVTSRIGAGNPRTGKRVEISVADLYAIAGAFDMDANELLTRALVVAGPEDELHARRRVSEDAPTVRRVAKKSREQAGEPEGD
jgi:hypothetical protein